MHVDWFYKRKIAINKYEFYWIKFTFAQFNLENNIKNIYVEMLKYHEILKLKIPLRLKIDAIKIK